MQLRRPCLTSLTLPLLLLQAIQLQAADFSDPDTALDAAASPLLSESAPLIEGILPPETAFSLSTFIDADNNAMLLWEISPAHYLYRDKLHVSTTEDRELKLAFPEAAIVTDEFFGESAVYFDRLLLTIPVGDLISSGQKVIDLELQYQGCAEDRYCYPPQRRFISIELP